MSESFPYSIDEWIQISRGSFGFRMALPVLITGIERTDDEWIVDVNYQDIPCVATFNAAVELLTFDRATTKSEKT